MKARENVDARDVWTRPWRRHPPLYHVRGCMHVLPWMAWRGESDAKPQAEVEDMVDPWRFVRKVACRVLASMGPC